MWPLISKKNIVPHFSSLVSLSFSTNVRKNAVFFLVLSFPNKAFVFPNSRISEARICCHGWSTKNLHFCICHFSKMKNKTAEKITQKCFPVKSKVTCKNIAHLEAKKNQPKKSPRLLMQAPLQF